MSYADFIAAKALRDPSTGLDVVPDLSADLFPFQADIVRWALRRGRAAIFADCGMGKTPMQLEWARHIPGRVLILAPLAVSAQTVREAAKFHIRNVEYARAGDKTNARIVVTNYEMLPHFDVSDFAGIVLDESSILKAYDGKTRTEIIEAFGQTPFRLACTATPAPNDYMELGNHAEFLGTLTRTEMLSTYFVHDGGETQKWRLKGHAQQDFWRWLCSWAVMIRKPSDLGYDDAGFALPPIEYHERVVHAQHQQDGYLFAMPASSLQERLAARRDTLDERCGLAAEIVKSWPMTPNITDSTEYETQRKSSKQVVTGTRRTPKRSRTESSNGPQTITTASLPRSANTTPQTDKRRAYMRERYKTKRDDIIEYNRKRRAERPQVEQDWYLRKEYGLTLAEYDAMLAAQDGCCAICRKQHKRRLAVDHDHNTGRVRGLLCSSCNNGLGRFEDDADRMRRAVDYLDESKRRS